ncbi:MAG: hypothetical protein D6729_01210 [Deltaproteobacteria bacterium]|nr:MAG: hypothetical protein D6729_01210 [Deltaproteobacteria bacterium]
MSDFAIDLDGERVEFDGTWYTAEELGEKITQMISAKDFRIAKAGQALESLQSALNDAKQLEVRVPSTVLGAIEDLAQRDGRTVGAVVREALIRFIGVQGLMEEPAPGGAASAGGAPEAANPGASTAGESGGAEAAPQNVTAGPAPGWDAELAPSPAPAGVQPVPAVATEPAAPEEAAQAIPLTQKADEAS